MTQRRKSCPFVPGRDKMKIATTLGALLVGAAALAGARARAVHGRQVDLPGHPVRVLSRRRWLDEVSRAQRREQHQRQQRPAPRQPQLRIHGNVRSAQGPMGLVHRFHLSRRERRADQHAQLRGRRPGHPGVAQRQSRPRDQGHAVDDRGRVSRRQRSVHDLLCGRRRATPRCQGNAVVQPERRHRAVRGPAAAAGAAR